MECIALALIGSLKHIIRPFIEWKFPPADQVEATAPANNDTGQVGDTNNDTPSENTPFENSPSEDQG